MPGTHRQIGRDQRDALYELGSLNTSAGSATSGSPWSGRGLRDRERLGLEFSEDLRLLRPRLGAEDGHEAFELTIRRTT